MTAHGERGATLVEAAIVLPLMLALFAGVVQWGLIISGQIAVRHASAMGLREAMRQGATNSTIEAEARAAARSLEDARLAVAVANITDPSLGAVRQLTVTYNQRVFLPIVVPSASGGQYTLTSVTVFR